MSFYRGGRSTIPKGGADAPSPTPCNCKHPCCYGRGTSFCWPCMKDIMEEFNNKKVSGIAGNGR